MKYLVVLIAFCSCCRHHVPDKSAAAEVADAKSDSTLSMTPCMQQLIADFKTNNNCNLAKIELYSFQDKHVYVFETSACCCDRQDIVYDESCNILCSLGGIAGNAQCGGTTFYDHAILISVILSK